VFRSNLLWHRVYSHLGRVAICVIEGVLSGLPTIRSEYRAPATSTNKGVTRQSGFAPECAIGRNPIVAAFQLFGGAYFDPRKCRRAVARLAGAKG
jgi:hypothetical protein